MSNFLPANAVEPNGYKNGAVLDKAPTEFFPYHVSVRGRHVTGTPTFAPIVVDKVGPESSPSAPADDLGKPYMAYAGFMPCLDNLSPTLYTGGSVSGNVQLSARKYRSRDGMHSDISPIYPPPAVEISNLPSASYTWLALNTSTQQLLAQSFTTANTITNLAVPLSKNEQTFGAALLKLRKSTGATGNIKVSIYNDSGGSPQFPMYTSRVISVADLTDVSTGADYTFIFDGVAALASGGTYWLVLSAANLVGTVDWATKAGSFVGEIKIYNGSSWGAGTAGVDAYFKLLAEGGSARFAHNNSMVLSSHKIGINGYWFLADDIKYEDYDCIQLLIRESSLGDGFRVVSTLPIESLPTNGTEIIFNGDISTTASDIEIFPFYNRPFGGHIGGLSLNDGKQERLILWGQPGFDNYTSMLNQVYFATAPVQQIETDPFVLAINSLPEITFYGYPSDYATVYAALNNRILTVYRTDGTQYSEFGGLTDIPLLGYEQFRAILSVLDSSGTAVIKLTNIRGSLLRYNAASDPSILRAELRKQVFGQIEKWSDSMFLYFKNPNGTYSAANIVDRWMINHRAIVEGQGEGEIIRVDRFADGLNTGSPYINGNWYPTNKIRLVSPWAGENGYGQFSLVADKQTLFIGGGRADNWEGTAPSMRLPIISRAGIRAVGLCKGQLTAVCEKDEIYIINLSIVEPETFEDAVGFDVTANEFSQITKRMFGYTHAGPPTLATDEYSNIYWQGAEGIYQFDLNAVNLISRDSEQEKFATFYSPGFIHVNGALDNSHQYGPVMYFGGYALDSRPFRMNNMRTDIVIDSSGTGNTDPKTVVWGDIRLRQNNLLAYNVKKQTWTTLYGYGDAESMCSVMMSDGKQHMLAGAGGFLFVFKPNNYTYGRINNHNLYFDSVTAEFFVDDSLSKPVIVLSSVDEEDFDVSGWEQYLQSGVFLAKIDSTGFFELAEIISRCPIPAGSTGEVAFLLRPENTWTISDDPAVSYGVIFGARQWRLLLPIMIAAPPNKSVRAERINAKLSDGLQPGSAFQWPYYFILRNSAGTPNTPIAFDYELYLRSTTDELRFDQLVTITEMNVTQSGIFGGIHPPNSHLTVVEINVYYREQLGG